MMGVRPLHIQFIALISVLVINVMAAPVLASNFCPQESAIYQSSNKNIEIAFSSVGEAQAASHNFIMSFAKVDISFEAFVVPEGEPERPYVYMMRNCPDGDVTGADLDACTVWRGVAYGRDKTGSIVTLPHGQDLAVSQLLLPDFARSVFFYLLDNKDVTLDQPEEDVFNFARCGDIS